MIGANNENPNFILSLKFKSLILVLLWQLS
jgi:hypothetical protein